MNYGSFITHAIDAVWLPRIVTVVSLDVETTAITMVSPSRVFVVGSTNLYYKLFNFVVRWLLYYCFH